MRLEVDEAACRRGRVLSVHGLTSTVQADEGEVYQCATRRLLKTLSTDQRHVVAAGDRVLFRPVENTRAQGGIIERVEPRHGTISRADPRPPARAGHQRRSAADRGQRGRAAA